MNDELVERQAAYNLHFLPLPGRANDRETQMARLQDYMIADRDEDAAKRVRDYYGEGVPVGAVSEKAMQYFVGAAMARNLGISGAPEAYWLGREKPEALPEVEQQDDLYTEMGRDLITKTQDAWVKQQVKLQERRQTLGTVLQQIVQEGEANKKESAAWLGFLDAQGRGVWSEDEAVSLVKATEAFSMMRGLVDDPQSAGANVLTKGSTGQLIFDALYGDEMATGLFFTALQDRIADMKTAEEERNALVQFAHAFESATKNLTAGMMGGHFRAFVTDEQVDEYNAKRSRHEAFQAVLQGAAGADYEAAGGLSVMEDMRLQEIAHAARESGQLNADGSLRKMTDEERRSTQELNEFRGQLHNAVQGVYDIDGLAKLGKMMPGSLAYLVPGGMLASAMSMRTHDLASQLGEGSDWVSANARATVNAAIQAGVEKMAFGSIKATKMAPGLDALMSTGPMARVFGKLYGTTAGRIGIGVVAGGLEETFAEPAAGLLLSGIYNAFAPTGLELDSPWVAYKNEMAEMLKPDQILATALYGLLLGGVNVPGHRAEAKHYKKVVEGLERIGIDHNVAANMARSDGSLQQIAAGVQQVDAALKKDAGGVFGYIAELYPQLQEISTFENLMRAYNLPKMLPGEGGNVRVQYKDEDGKVQELVMSQEAGRLFVQARIEQLGSKVQVGFADMVLGQVMTGKVAEKSDSWVVSVEDADMNADYFRRIAAAAGIRLSQGAKATDIVPEIHPYIPLGTLAQQGRAWESRMRVARGEAEEKLGRKLTDEEWAQREKQLVSRVNRVRVASQDGRVRTVLRVARGGYGAMEVLEDVTEDFLSLDMEENGRELGWYADNLLELERVLGRQGAFLHALKEGESYDRMAIIEGVGKLVQSKVLADTTKKYKLSEKLNAFLDMIRHLVQRAVAMLKLGKAINKVLADKEASAKLDPEFVGMVDRLVEKDVEFLRELQLEDGLAAMQRVLEQRVPSTPVLAEAKHGGQVREEAAAKAAAQRAVDADVAEGEAAVEGSMSADTASRYHVVDDSVELEKRLDDVVDVVEISFVEEEGKNWLKEAKQYFSLIAGRVFSLENTEGFTLKMPDHRAGRDTAVKGIRKKHQFKAEVIKKFEELFKKVVLLDRQIPAHKDKETPSRKKRVAAAKVFYKFGWPVRINGTEKMFWFGADAYDATNEKNVVFYEFGLQGMNEKGDSAVRTVLPDEEVEQGTESPLSAITLGDYLANVKLNPNQERVLPEVVSVDTETKEDSSLSVAEAEEAGLFDGGMLEASNAVVTAPSFSIEALHATPHRFRKFDTSKMGTGEGAQAFGWGLYFAENAATAKSYYDNFEKGNRAILQGDKQIASADVLEKIARELSAEGLSKEESKMYATGAVRRLMGGSDLAQLVDKLDADKKDFPSHEKSIEYQIKALRIILGLGLSTAAPSVYRVELNVDDSTLLLWDSPVSDALQAEIDALQKPVDEEDWQNTFAEMKALGIKGDDSKRENFAGYQVYNELVRKTGSPKSASEWLAEHGVKGIKYFDGFSRYGDKEKRTYNYVIFSGDDVKVTGVNETGRYDAPWEDYEDVDASFSTNMAVVTPEMDARYMSAVKRGDMDAARRIVNDVARMRGYMADSDYQGAECFNGTAPSANAYFDTDEERYEAWENGEFEGTVSLADFVRRGMEPGNLEWLITSPGAYQRANEYQRESIEAIRKAKSSKRGKVTIYRAVPSDIKEGSVRNGDWVTFSKAYAKYHISLQDWEKGRIIKQLVSIDDVWWDGNDVNEWGYDDGKEYAYRNTTHNRKLLAPVTYDKNGDVVPLSKRFDYRSGDVSFSVVGENSSNWEEIKHLAFRGRDDGKLRVELDSSQARLKKAPLHRMDVSLVREVDRRLAFFRDELEKKKRWETVSKLWSVGEYDLRTYDEMDFLRRVLRGAGIEFRNLPQMAELGVCAMVLDGDGAKRLLKVVDMPGVEGFNQLGEVLDFPELFEAYPELKKLPVRWMDDTFRYKGSYLTDGRFSEPFIMARRNRKEGGKLSTLLHEAQHWIQHHEDFAFGSVPGGVKDYKVSAGEIEARNVQTRRWLSAEERAALPFNETLTHPDSAEAYSVAALAGSMSVVGASAANWDKIKHRAFKGRDDGKLRVEIDASQAKIKNLGVSDEYAEQEAGMLLWKVDKFVEGLSAEKRELLEKYIEVYNSDFPDEEREAAIKEERRLEEANKETLDSLHAELGGMVERMWIESILPGVDYREYEMRAQVREYYEKNIKLDERRYLGDVLDFEALYEAYPKLRYTPVSFRRLGTGTNAQVERRNGKDYIVIHEGLLRYPEGEMLRTLLHEVQHVIQGIEGFAQGGNEDYANELALMRESVEPEKYGWVLNKSPYELYRRLAGEVEARNVQRRMWYSAVEREMLPFNSTMDIPEYETLVSFSLSPTLMEDIARARKRAKNADGTISQDGEMPRGAEVPLCTMPDFMRFLGEADVPIVARVFTLRKLLTDHKLTDELTYEVVQKMNDPVLAIQETPSTYLVLLDVQAENKDGVMAPVVCAVEHKKGKDGNRYLVSAYSLDNDKERKITQQFKKLVYCKYNTTAKFTADAPQGRAYDLLRAAISGGHTRNVATYEDVVKGKENSSYSIVDLNGEEISHLVAVAGSGMKANEAFVEKMMAEIRGSLLRMRKLGSKTRTDREDALVAMGGISQMVKALVLSLPQGYRFAVQPYMNKLDVLTELATTGNVEMLRENVSKGLQAWMDETSENWHEVLPQLSGNENMTREELTARVQEMMKEHAGQQLTEAVERIVERVAGQLRKHAKDTAVKRMRELLERVMPKKDPKSGKQKGGKMSADDYRDLEDVQAALDMNAEELEAKMAALKAEMETPGLSEEKRDEKEALLMLYDQFGDPDSMSAEEAVAAYEALRQRIWMSRFEWENIQSEKRAARRAVVRRIVEGVGSVSENEYNAKKRRVKPTKRMKNLGDVLAGMPAAVGALRGYLPLREMADSLTRRANRAGELIKEWEAERWIALEALSKQTLGKSWRLSMDYMHKVLPTGVAFERPVYRTVDIKVPALRELLQMDAKARVAEMKRRREAGGKEAETALSERDIEAAAKELERMDEAGEVKGWVHTRYLKELRREENLQLSRGEALYAILMYEQPTYTERMEAQGYTPEVVAGLKKFIGDGMLEFGYGLRELFRIQGDKIAAIYEREFGVPFPREENYFAARWDVTEMKENPAEQLLAGMAGTPGAGNGWMKTRVNHELELDMTKDALQVFLQATTLTDTWMATQDIVADFKAWTRDKDFARALTALLGEESYTNLKDWIRILEQGGAQDCLNMGVTQDVINGLYGSGAVAILGLRVQTLIRQLPSVFNGMLGASDITAGEWFATLARMKHGDAPMTFKRMKDSVLMKNRRQGRAGNMASQAVRSGDTDSSVTEEFLLASMLPMEWMDASCTAMSLVPVWNVYYDRAVRKGANHQEAEQAAWEQTTVVANLASQPIGWLNKSKIAQSRNPIVKSMFYMLSENTAKFALCRALWKGRNKKAAVRAWLVYGAANAAISALLDCLQGDPDEWEKGEWWEYMLSALYGPAASLPGVGEALEALGTLVLNVTGHALDIEALQKAKARASVGRALIDVGGTWRAMQKLYEFMTDDKEHTLAEYTRAASTVSRTLAIGTGWMGNMVGYWSTALAVLTNPVDFVARVYRNMKQYYEEE